MEFQSINYNDLFNKIAKNMASRAGITNFGPSSKAANIITSIVDEEKNKFNLVNSVLDSLKLESAFGQDLDKIGNLFGVQRLDATRAVTKVVDKNIEFYVTSGTFGDINGGNSFTIPANTIIYLESKDSTAGFKIQYRLLTSVTCSASSSFAYANVEAFEIGTQANVASFTLNKHDFSSYVDYVNKTLKVRNNFAIVNGRDVQTDQSYRYNISKTFTALAGGNEIALKLAALSFPGVKDAKFIRNYNGIGASSLFIDTFEGSTSPTLLGSINQKLSIFSSGGEIITAYAPKYISFKLDLVLKTSRNLTTNEKSALNNNVLLVIKNFFSSIRLGEGLDLDNLYDLIIRTNPFITQIGRKSGVNKAEEIIVYYSDSLGNYSLKTLLQNNLSINQEQKIILIETETPITLTIEK